MDDPAQTLARLVEAEALLLADPTNEALRDRVRLLSHAYGCLAWNAAVRRQAARGRLFIGAYMRRN